MRKHILDNNNAPVSFSPTGQETIDICEKKYFFNWLNKRRQGWRPKHIEADSILFRVYVTNKIQDRFRWSGSLFHQIMSKILKDIVNGLGFDNLAILNLASELVELQHNYSYTEKYLTERESKAFKYQGISCYLVLSEHYHNLECSGLVEQVQSDVQQWLLNTFNWEHWEALLALIKGNPIRVEIEPENCKYRIHDVNINARMDLGIETSDDKFIVFDWKCQKIDEQFKKLTLEKYRRQLRAYVMWSIYRDFKPLEIKNVTGNIFNPIEGKSYRFQFSESDCFDFEQEVKDWHILHSFMFPHPEEQIFEELAEPNSMETVCPHCQFQSICGESIKWHEQK